MTAAVQVDLTHFTNETWSDTFTWAGSFDLTGMAIKLQLRDPNNSQNVVLEMSTANTFLAVVQPASAGTWKIALPAANAKDVPPGAYPYDVIAYLDADPRVWRMQYGTLTVAAGLTFR